MTVPSRYQGLWRRTGIWRSNGTSDLSTQVWWFQAARFHIDLRIPIDRPVVDSRVSLLRMNPGKLARFSAQSGFAGSTIVEGDRCEWRPEIAFPGLSGDLDAGWMRFDSDDAVHETGLDNSYEEDWVRMASGPMQGVRMEDSGSNALAYLIVGERWMAWACGRPTDRYDAAAPEIGEWSEFTVLHKGGGWRIAASTLPWLEGEEMPDADALESQQWMAGSVLTVPFSPASWRITAIS